MPVHGEYRHLKHHGDLAESLGMKKSNIFILETGNVFDLQNELKGRMNDAGRALHFRENLKWILYALEGLVILAVIIIILMIIFL